MSVAAKLLRRETYLCLFLMVSTAAMLARASELADTVDVAARVERLGIVGILIWILIVLSVCFVWLVRLMITKGFERIDQNTKAMQELRDVVRECHERRD